MILALSHTLHAPSLKPNLKHHPFLAMKVFALQFLLPSVVMAFSAVSPDPMASKKTAEKRLNFHQVLQRVGKTVFRPGGSENTMIMHDWADLKPGNVVLELSSGLGTGGMALAEKYGCSVILSDQDESRLCEAEKIAQRRGLGDLVQVRKLDMRSIAETLPKDDHYDAVVVEASLTHMPNAMKQKIMRDLLPHTEQLLIHEIGLHDCTEEKASEIRRKLGLSLAVGFHPVQREEWQDMLDRNGYQVTHQQSGPLKFLSPKSILQDEGPLGMAKIAWNLATQTDLRERVLSTKKIINSYSDSLGYIILRATKK